MPPRILRIAAQKKADTLVVFLHGVGANADDLYPIARHWSGSLPGADILLPDGFQPFDGGGPGRQWFSLGGLTDATRGARIREAALQVSAWLDGELATRKLAPGRVVLVGFSQGAMLSEWLAVHREPRPAAVVAFSGRFADDSPAPAGGAAGHPVPVLLVHGTEDPRIPVQYAEEARAALTSRGALVETRIEPGLGHGISQPGAEHALAFARARGGP